jgi:hypothetical protein
VADRAITPRPRCFLLLFRSIRSSKDSREFFYLSGLFGLSRSFGLSRLFGLTGPSDRQTRETRPTRWTRQAKERLNPIGFHENQNGFS